MKRVARRMSAVSLVACVATVLWGAGAEAGPTGGFFFADGFQRPDSTDMGPYWTEQWSDWRVEGEVARSAPGDQSALMTVEGYELDEPILEVTVRYDGTARPTYVALVSLYLDNAHCIFVKIQDGWKDAQGVEHDVDGLYDTVWFYQGNNSGQPWGDMVAGYDDWDDLAPYFSEARVGTYIVGDEVVVGIDRDFDGVPESLYARDGIPLDELGLGVGLGGYNDAWADNFLAVPEPATLAVMGLGAAVFLARRRKRAHWRLAVLVVVVCLGLAVAASANGQPAVQANLTHTKWTGTGGDGMTNQPMPYEPGWLVYLEPQGPGPVTGPHVEFTSDGPFVDFWPPPMGFVAPSTYVWDYPGMVLVPGGMPLHVGADEAGLVATPGFTATRAVDTPLLVAPVTTQTVDLTVTFEDPLAPHLNHVGVDIGSFWWDQPRVQETVVFQNNVPGWTVTGDGWWTIDPSAIVLGTPYHFQAQIQCTKQPGFEGATIYHKPQAFVTTADWQNLPQHTGTETLLVHPEGETALVRVNEAATWHPALGTGGQDAFLESVSLNVDDVGLTVSDIEMYYGKEHDGQGNYLGHYVGAEAYGRNIVAAEMTTPTGRTWPMTAEEDRPGPDVEFWAEGEYLSPADLAALGIVSGTYTFTFHGPLGELLTTSVDLTLGTPTQIPNLLDPTDGEHDVPRDKVISWDAVGDPTVDGIFLDLDEDEGPWEFWTEEPLPPGAESFLVEGMPADAGIECFLGFGMVQEGTTPEGVDWQTVGYTGQEIDFRTVPEPATLAFLAVGVALLTVGRRRPSV